MTGDGLLIRTYGAHLSSRHIHLDVLLSLAPLKFLFESVLHSSQADAIQMGIISQCPVLFRPFSGDAPHITQDVSRQRPLRVLTHGGDSEVHPGQVQVFLGDDESGLSVYILSHDNRPEGSQFRAGQQFLQTGCGKQRP